MLNKLKKFRDLFLTLKKEEKMTKKFKITPLDKHVEITLDEATHTYAVNGFTPDTQISVTTLLHGASNFQGGENIHCKNGTFVHKQLQQYLTEENAVQSPSNQTLLLAHYLKSRHPCQERKIEFERRVGAKITLADDTELYVFGSIDCICENYIWEFKTATKHSSTHKWQVAFYRYLLHLNGVDVDGALSVICAVDGIADHSHISLKEIEQQFNDKLLNYLNKKNNVEDLQVVDTQGLDFVDVQARIQEAKNLVAELEKQRDRMLDKIGIRDAQAGSYLLNDQLVLKKIKCFRTDIDRDLVAQKLPQAIREKEYFTTKWGTV